MHEVFARFGQVGVIPVLEIDSAEDAAPLAESLAAGGLPLAEVTLRTEAALRSIEAIRRAHPHVLAGAGTVLTAEQARAAHAAGAQFLVCPGMAEEVVHWAQARGVPVLAGAVTPTEMMRGLSLGLDVLKFFPSEAMGGLRALAAASDPFPGLRFIPTGGIRAENLAEYLRAEKVLAAGGSWMAKRAMIRARQFEEITRLAAQAAEIAKGVRGS